LHLYVKAVRFWQVFEKKLGTSIDLKITGGLMVADDQGQLDFLAEKAERERELGLEVDIFDRKGLDGSAPYLRPGVVGGEVCHLEGKLNPLLANAAVRRWINRLTVTVLAQELVQRVERVGARFRLHIARGTVDAGRVIIAAGAGSRSVAASLGVNLPV